MSSPSETHRPVMSREVLGFLLDAPGEIFIDATLGDGGHARALLSERPDIVLYGIDRDIEAIEFAKERLCGFGHRIQFIHGRFGEIAKKRDIPPAAGVLFDLGLSSRQVDNPERGFSFSRDARLDMRMDTSQKTTAYDIVNETSRGELTKIIATYGEQPGAGRIARAIDVYREKEPIETTLELAGIVRKAIHPATAADLARVFQSIRIVVNDELGELKRGLAGMLEVLMPGGIMVVISYHSLEDRIVKQFFVTEEKGCICDPDMPVCRCGHKPRLERLTKKPIVPSESEIKENPRARSAKLRAASKLI
ncbi:16S rRNA (cytosine(1402)-N(4))-methyltransferase [bacterium]|nr:MAG: 16S rRNA (cytosine(1402)-N(4))-methyltransferase [bacterium]